MAISIVSTIPSPGSIAVNTTSGEYLHFTLDTPGPLPKFSFASGSRGVLWEPLDFSAIPLLTYTWDHFRNPTDIQGTDVLTLVFIFIGMGAAAYTYTVTLCRADGTTSTLLQLAYTGLPTDIGQESLVVVTI